MAHLFEQIPDTLFNVLSSPNKNIYVDCLFIIYDATNSVEDSFQGERNFVISKLVDYFDELKDEFSVDEEESSTSRQKAVSVINVLKSNGWLGEEELGDYKVSLNLFDYSIMIIDLLKRIQVGEQMEYTGEIFTIYSLLASFEIEDGLTILEQSYRKIDDVLRKLKTLRANIYRFYFDLVRTEKRDNLQVILERLLVDYKTNFFDNAYYQLKTTDSLPRYKRSILQNINDIYKNEQYLDTMANQAITQGKRHEFNDAFEYVEERIRYINESVESIEFLVQSIDEKNEMYINAAASKILFLTNTSEDLEGLFNRFFTLILNQKHFDYSEVFNLFNARNLDDESLQTIRRKRVDAVADEINYDQEISDEVRERKMATLVRSSIYSKRAIDTHVKYLLSETDVVKASETPLDTNEDFIKLILIFLYSNSVGMSYKISLLNYDANVGDIKFNDFEIIKKGIRK